MIFIDSGAFLARYLAGDQHHVTARRGWKRIRSEGLRCSTSHDVLDETFTLLARRAGYPFAVERPRAVLASEVLTILRAGGQETAQALALFEKLADQRVSFTDCLCFALMRREGIRRAFSFDRRFVAVGFELWP